MEHFGEIAARIRELRESCGYEAEQLARELHIDVGDYRAYEEKGDNIPISVIYQIAGKFGVDFTEIITGSSAKLNTYHVVHHGCGMSVDRFPGYSFQDLAFRYSHKIMQPLLVTIEPSDVAPALVTHGGQEFNMVLEGSIILYFDKKEIKLETGDSCYFNPKHPHGQRCVGDKTARFLTVITN